MRTLLAILITVAPSIALGATIVPNTNVAFGPGMPGNYAATVDQDLFGDYTSTWFEFQFVGIDDFRLQVVSWNLDEESDWYLVEAGDAFSKQSIAAGKFTPLFTTDHPYPAVSVGSDFYLGVNTGVSFEARESFGWLHLRLNNVAALTMVENVMAYDSPGIIVGTTTVVPEPSTIALLGFSLLGAILRRRQ